MKYWLIKSEPNSYSIDDLAKLKQKTDHWDGIRNYQVRNMIRDKIKINDIALFYHSSCKVPGIVGITKVVKNAYPDHFAWDNNSKYFDPKSDPDNPRWLMFDVKLIKKFSKIITLQELKQHPEIAAMPLFRKGNRLSITPVTKEQYEFIIALTNNA